MLDPNVNESILLYRYLRADAALKTIKSRLLRVGRISELNDPFEWRLGVTGIIPQGESIAHGCMQQVIDGLHAWMGILCFSDTSMEPVLWSHYPEKHHGVAFEFDYKIDPERLFKMSYSNERPVIDANRLLNPNGLDDYLLPILTRLMTQKSPGWAYEREYRAFVNLNNDCEVSNGMYFRRIPDSFLRRIILGFKCPLKEGEVLSALQSIGLTSTSVTRTKMSLSSYEIRC